MSLTPAHVFCQDSRILQSLSVYERPSEGAGDHAEYGDGWFQHPTGCTRERV